MKVEISTPKRGKKCSYCSSMITKDEKFIETIDWIPNVQYSIKKNVCMKCVESRIEMIPKLESLLKDLRLLKANVELI